VTRLDLIGVIPHRTASRITRLTLVGRVIEHVHVIHLISPVGIARMSHAATTQHKRTAYGMSSSHHSTVNAYVNADA
jgi:predicted transcriptional regulator